MQQHFHFGEETHAVTHTAGVTALIGLLLHTFFDGVLAAAASTIWCVVRLIISFGVWYFDISLG